MTVRARILPLLALLLGGATAAPGVLMYRLDPATSSIAFSVDHLGLFTTEGYFAHFTGALDVDPAAPERTKVEVAVDADSIFVPWPEGIAKLRSPTYFDTAEHPAVRFTSTAVTSGAGGHYQIVGNLEIRSITHPLTLDATLTGCATDPATNVQTADLMAVGQLSRAAYGMTADHIFISDSVKLRIRAHIALAPGAHVD